jgi:hypothetical protein
MLSALMQMRMENKSGLKERRRKVSQKVSTASNDEDMSIDNAEEFITFKVDITSSSASKGGGSGGSFQKMAGSSPRTRLRNLERTSSPMLDMIEQQTSDPRSDEANDELRLSSSQVYDCISSYDTLGKPVMLEDLSRSTSLDSSEYSQASTSTVSKEHQLQQQKTPRFKELDVDKYMASREMTPFQERMNAVTVMPGAFYCIMYLLSGSWLNKTDYDELGYEPMTPNNHGGSVFDDSQCLSWRWMPHLHALPPLPLVAAALGIILHAPFSFIYHWKYAHRLPAGLPRTTHWSRRMDQAMIHVCSGCMAYATSGRWDFFLANALFNIDCIYRQFMKKVRPRRNQIRIFISLVAYTIPLLRRGDLILFSKIWLLFGISGWLFSKYPIGGWSHSVFHIVMAFVPPLLMTAAVELPASQPQLMVAAQCAAIAKESLVT